MDLSCRTCGTAFAVEDAVVPAEGAGFPCPRCGANVPVQWPALELALDVPEVPPSPPRGASQAVLEATSESSMTSAHGVGAASPGSAMASVAARGVRAGPVAAKAPARPPARPPGMVVISAAPVATPWRLYAAVGGTALAAALVVIVVGIVRSRPPPPPRMPNPLRAQVAIWGQSKDFLAATTVDAGVLVAREALVDGGDRGVRRALAAARGALLLDADNPAAIASYALALAWLPGWVDGESIDQALGAITSAIGEAPDSVHRADLEEARAWLHIRRHELEAARQAAHRAVQLRPGAPRPRLAEAVTRMRARPDEVARELDAMAGEGLPRLALWRGEARLLTGEVGQAVKLWEGALKGKEPDAPLIRRLAQLWLAVGDLAAARVRLRELCENGWASVDDRLHYSRLLAREDRDPVRAMEQLDAALGEAASPIDRARVLAERVAVALGARKLATPAQLSAWLDEALALAPDLPELLYVAGLVDLQAEARESALDSLEAAVELRPDRPEVAFVLAQALEGEGVDAARQVVNAGLAERPDFVPLHLLRAWLDLRAGDPVSAATSIRRALDFDPLRLIGDPVASFAPPSAAYAALGRQLLLKGRKADNPMLLTAAAVAFLFAREQAQGQAALSQALRSDPNEVGARLYRAIVAYRRNQLGPARRDLGVALRTDSRHRVVRHYQALTGLQGQRTAVESERIWRDLLDANGLDTAARVGLARALWVRGQREDARSEALKVLGVRPDDREALSFFLAIERPVPRKKR